MTYSRENFVNQGIELPLEEGPDIRSLLTSTADPESDPRLSNPEILGQARRTVANVIDRLLATRPGTAEAKDYWKNALLDNLDDTIIARVVQLEHHITTTMKPEQKAAYIANDILPSLLAIVNKIKSAQTKAA